ncbi:MAG: ABC transporter [Pseudonocardia sp. SCN 72-86]|nr:MAG: ABC transporter [Pseudonocardia sp. SCN 72-86]
MRGTPIAVLAVLVVIILVGPFFAPYSPTAPVGVPFALPGRWPPLGTDDLGRDVLSRLLDGGRPMLLTSLAGAVLGSLIGAVVGLSAALLGARKGRRDRWAEAVVLRPFDAVAALPPMLVLLLVLTSLPARAGIVLAVAVTSAPLSARVLRAAAAPVVARAHVEAAMARGESTAWLLGREVLPLVAGPLAADAGLRLVSAVYLATAAGFLGIGASGSDWGTLIVQALPGAELQPVALAAPVLGVALLTITVNLVADDLIRRSRAVLG